MVTPKCLLNNVNRYFQSFYKRIVFGIAGEVENWIGEEINFLVP